MPDDVTLAPAAAPRVSFEELYRSSYTRMVVVARLTVGDLARAEELVQDAFAQLYRRWGEVSQPHGYLRIAVMNTCRSHERRRVVEQRHPVPRPHPRCTTPSRWRCATLWRRSPPASGPRSCSGVADGSSIDLRRTG